MDGRYTRVFPGGSHATSVVETVGMLLFALYHVSTIIVLINMLYDPAVDNYIDNSCLQGCTYIVIIVQWVFINMLRSYLDAWTLPAYTWGAVFT